MHKPDRIGLLVIAFAFFALYVGVSNWLSLLGFVFLPLGTVDPFPLLLADLAILFVYIARQRKRFAQS